MSDPTSGWLPLVAEDEDTAVWDFVQIDERSDGLFTISIEHGPGRHTGCVAISEDTAMTLAEGLIGRIMRRRQKRIMGRRHKRAFEDDQAA